jgi:hypothetical protein
MAAALLFIPLACLGIGLLWLVWGPRKKDGQPPKDDAPHGVAMPPLPLKERAPLPPRPDQHTTPTDATQLDAETIRAINELSANIEELNEEQEPTRELEDQTPYVGEVVPLDAPDEEHVVDGLLDGVFDNDSTSLNDDHLLGQALGHTMISDDIVWDDAWVTAAMDEDDVSPELYGDLNDIFSEPAHAAEPFDPTEASTAGTPTIEDRQAPPAASGTVAPASSEQPPEPVARYRRRRSDKRVALAKFPYDPEVWDDPLSAGKRRRLEKRAELDRRRAEELRDRTYKRVEKARLKHAELETVATEEAVRASAVEVPAGANTDAEFNDVWSRATLLEAPDRSGIEQPRERAQRKNAKKAARSKARAAKAAERLARLTQRHEKRQELVTKREEASMAALTSDPVDIEGVGVEGVQHAEISDSVEVRDFSENALAAETPMTIEVLENLPAPAELVSGGDLSEREQRRAEKKAERESRKLEKLAMREKKRTERAEASTTSTGAGAPSNADALEFEPGLGTAANSGSWDEAAFSSAAGSAADALERTQAELQSNEPEPMTATLWEQAMGTEDGLQAAAVSSWEVAAQGITEFIDPTGGVHATDAEEWIELGEDIADTAEAGPGRGKDAFIESEDVEEDAPSSYDTIIEIGTSSAVGKKRRFARRKKDEDVEDDGGVSIGEWVSEGATLVTVTSDYVDHHSYDLPEPIPDRVQVAFGSDE